MSQPGFPQQSLLTFADTEKSPLSIRAKALVFVDPRSRQLREQSNSLALRSLPAHIGETLALARDIEALAEEFADKQHALFLGRGEFYPIAMEGSLKLKEISYIHAEAYAAGELKHGPLALIDADMPVMYSFRS